MADPLDKFRTRITVPSDKVTEDWRPVPGWLKERAFWMAGVTDVQILDAFRDEIDLILSGESSGTESIGRLQDFLDEIGYEAKPDQKGSIKDLRTWNRISRTLDTNVEMMQGYGRYLRQIQPAVLKTWPAQRFVRVFNRDQKREWSGRWQRAYDLTKGIPGATPSDGDNDQPGEALVTHPIWEVLSEFGQPYPPFDWGSGMGVEPIGRVQAKDLGLLDDPRAMELINNPPARSPNENLSVSVADIDDKLLDSLQERMKGLAYIKDGRLYHADPNGTKPYTANELDKVWAKGVPEGFELEQKNALNKIVSGDTIEPDTLEADHTVNLYNRLINERGQSESVYKVAQIKDRDVDRLTSLDVMGAVLGSVADIWMGDIISAVELLDDAWNVIYILRNGSRGKDVTNLISQTGEAKVGAWLYLDSQMLKVQEVTRKQSERTIEILLEEI